MRGSRVCCPACGPETEPGRAGLSEGSHRCRGRSVSRATACTQTSLPLPLAAPRCLWTDSWASCSQWIGLEEGVNAEEPLAYVPPHRLMAGPLLLQAELCSALLRGE